MIFSQLAHVALLSRGGQIVSAVMWQRTTALASATSVGANRNNKRIGSMRGGMVDPRVSTRHGLRVLGASAYGHMWLAVGSRT